ncbi:MAG: cupin domain-containing protein [Candidatus Aminicenantes bacterium]|nr:cupin domain-containing protein [Candidatus Aminicenantes bacterium]HHF52429.1 cupin domain-containing protein [Candidatus Aminicenantes bacterium]
MFKHAKKNHPSVEVFKGVVRTTLACGKDILMARFDYKKGSQVPPHRHSYEQVTVLIKGKQKVIIENKGKKEEIILEEGDSYMVPASFEHQQISLEDTVTIDSWSLAP